jgi:hypothetical protein
MFGIEVIRVVPAKQAQQLKFFLFVLSFCIDISRSLQHKFVNQPDSADLQSGDKVPSSISSNSTSKRTILSSFSCSASDMYKCILHICRFSSFSILCSKCVGLGGWLVSTCASRLKSLAHMFLRGCIVPGRMIEISPS